MSDRHTPAAKREGQRRRYLGDGVYVVSDGLGFWLTAEDGIEATDAIYLEPAVYDALVAFVCEERG